MVDSSTRFCWNLAGLDTMFGPRVVDFDTGLGRNLAGFGASNALVRILGGDNITAVEATKRRSACL